MSRLPKLLGMVILGMSLIVGVGASQDAKKEEKKEEKKKEKAKEKPKDTLPPFFKGLDLTAEQKGKIADIQNSYKPKVGELQKKIGELNKQVGELNKHQTEEIFKVLTPEQKKKYDDDVAASKKKKEPEKKKEEKKKTDK